MSSDNDLAKEMKKAAKRVELNLKLTSARGTLITLEAKVEKLKKKIARFTTALTEINTGNESFQQVKSSMDGIDIDASSWSGEKADKVNVELATLKSDISSIATKVDDAVETIEAEKKEAENDLISAEAKVASQATVVQNLINSINSL